jgi:hypothetical protein
METESHRDIHISRHQALPLLNTSTLPSLLSQSYLSDDCLRLVTALETIQKVTQKQTFKMVDKTRAYNWYISLVAAACMVLYGYDASVYNSVQGSDHWVQWFNDPVSFPFDLAILLY